MYQSIEQLGVPCVKRGKGFCYFDCDIFYFGRVRLQWYSRQASCSYTACNGPNIGCFTTNNTLVTPDMFRELKTSF